MRMRDSCVFLTMCIIYLSIKSFTHPGNDPLYTCLMYVAAVVVVVVIIIIIIIIIILTNTVVVLHPSW